MVQIEEYITQRMFGLEYGHRVGKNSFFFFVALV